MPPTPKNREKYFSGNYWVKFGRFSGKKSCNSEILLLFRANIIKNSRILIIFWWGGQESCKIKVFCYFFIHGAKMSCPLKLTELLRLCHSLNACGESIGVDPARVQGSRPSQNCIAIVHNVYWPVASGSPTGMVYLSVHSYPY